MQDRTRTEVDMPDSGTPGHRTGAEVDGPQHPKWRQVVKVVGAAALAAAILGGSGFSADAMRDLDPHTDQITCLGPKIADAVNSTVAKVTRTLKGSQGAPVASIAEEPRKESSQSLREIRANFRDPSEVLSERAGQTRLEIYRDGLIDKGHIKSEGPEQGVIIGGLLKDLKKNGHVVDGVWTEQALLDGEISAEHVGKKPYWMHMNVLRKDMPLPDTSVREATDADVAAAYSVVPNIKRMNV